MFPQDWADKNPASIDTIKESLQMMTARGAHNRHGPAVRTRPRAFPRGDEQGAVAAELVVATPLLLLLILAVIQFALWQHATHVAQAVAAQDLAAARLDGAGPAAGNQQAQAVLSQLGRGLLIDPTVSSSYASPTAITVVVKATTESVIPFVHLPVTARASGPREVFTTSGVPGP